MRDHRLHTIHRISLSFFILMSVGTFVWLLAKDFVVSGVLDVTYDFSRPSPFITRLTSEDKVAPIVYGKDATQEMMKDPVGFTVQLPRQFHSMIVEVIYRTERQQRLRVGMQRQRGVWSPIIRDVVRVREEGGWTVGRAEFTRLKRFDFSDNKYQLILNAPDMSEHSDPIIFTNIRIIAERDPWTLGSFPQRVWNYFVK